MTKQINWQEIKLSIDHSKKFLLPKRKCKQIWQLVQSASSGKSMNNYESKNTKMRGVDKLDPSFLFIPSFDSNSCDETWSNCTVRYLKWSQ